MKESKNVTEIRQEDIRYTTTNQKVVILEKLNTTDCIVQEIYVTSEGTEVLGGEKFVCFKDNLHKKEPRYISWKEERIGRAIREYDTLLPKLEKEMDDLEQEHEEAVNFMKLLTEKVKEYSKITKCKEFDIIRYFLEGKIEYLLIEKYTKYEILSFKEALTKKSEYDFNDGIKLLTLFGRPGGGFSWKLNQYSDGSGSMIRVYPCLTKEEGIDKLDNLIKRELEGGKIPTKKMIEAQKKYTLSYPTKEQQIEYYNKEKEMVKKEINDLTIIMNKLKEDETEYENLIGEID